MNHQQVARSLTFTLRQLLIEHVDGQSYIEAPYSVQDPVRKRMALALIDRGLIRFTGYKQHQTTRITENGRQVLVWVLADYAEALIRAGYTGVAAPVSEVPGTCAPESKFETHAPSRLERTTA